MRARVRFAALLASLVIAAVPGYSQTAKPAPTLPPEILKAFRASYPKAALKAVSREKYAGKDAYEVESVDDGRTRDLIYLLDGTAVAVEEQIAAGDLPAAVAAAIRTDFPKATVTRYERAVEGGITSYEVELTGAKARSAEYTADGKRK